MPPALRELVNQLPRGSRLVCVFDCCYVTEKPAFRIHHSQRGGPVRTGVRVGVHAVHLIHVSIHGARGVYLARIGPPQAFPRNCGEWETAGVCRKP